jgi:deoxyribonuclease I
MRLTSRGNPRNRRAAAWGSAIGFAVACGGGPAVPQDPPIEVPPSVAPPPAPVPPPIAPDPAAHLPRTAGSLVEAVRLAEQIHADHRRTFLCDCEYTRDLKVVRPTCGYEARADLELSRVVAWEPVVPLRAFGSDRPCWKTPLCTDPDGKPFAGVECCRESDPVFRAMEGDLHNLVPVVAELQQDRSSYDFGEVAGEARMYGMCNFEVDHPTAVVEPRDDRRGDIARIYLYMVQTYGDLVLVDGEALELYRAWHEADPPDAWEIERNAKIVELQGNANPLLPVSG